MTQAEARALLERVDAGRLRREAGFTQVTVAAAFGLAQDQVSAFERSRGRHLPRCEGAFRWLRFTAALERRAAFAAEMDEAA